MKKSLLFWVIMFGIRLAHGQINAITETGEAVLLFENGTWKYQNEDGKDDSQIFKNDKQFNKDEESTFLVKSNKLNVGIWINPKKWSFTKESGDEVQEYQFQIKGEDLYGMLISEKIEIPIENLIEIAKENARSVAPDLKILKEEYRTVNGNEVLMMQMSGTIQGIKFVYYGYYFSNANGSIQLLTYTGESLFSKYSKDIELFLNGFVVL